MPGTELGPHGDTCGHGAGLVLIQGVPIPQWASACPLQAEGCLEEPREMSRCGCGAPQALSPAPPPIRIIGQKGVGKCKVLLPKLLYGWTVTKGRV